MYTHVNISAPLRYHFVMCIHIKRILILLYCLHISSTGKDTGNQKAFPKDPKRGYMNRKMKLDNQFIDKSSENRWWQEITYEHK